MKAVFCLFMGLMANILFLPQYARGEDNNTPLSSFESQELLVDVPGKLESVSEESHQEIASATISKIQVQNKHYSMHFFLLVALCLITTVMLFAIVIKVKQRYFS